MKRNAAPKLIAGILYPAQRHQLSSTVTGLLMMAGCGQAPQLLKHPRTSGHQPLRRQYDGQATATIVIN